VTFAAVPGAAVPGAFVPGLPAFIFPPSPASFAGAAAGVAASGPLAALVAIAPVITGAVTVTFVPPQADVTISPVNTGAVTVSPAGPGAARATVTQPS
jgi:hypothetical protein